MPGDASRVLLNALCIQVPSHGGLLVSGKSGAGKTTLLRAFAGLWHYGTGTIRRQMGRQVFFLPQRPYMQLGTLRDQLLYPFQESDGHTDEALEAILAEVGLRHVLERVDFDFNATRRWGEELSVGEQQRIGIARVLVHRPEYVILDEATAANDVTNEQMMYECVQVTCKAWISVGHRESIEHFHSHRLRLYGDADESREPGTWHLGLISGEDAAPYSPKGRMHKAKRPTGFLPK